MLMPKVVGAIQRKRARRPAEQQSDRAGIRPDADAILHDVLAAATEMHKNIARESSCQRATRRQIRKDVGLCQRWNIRHQKNDGRSNFHSLILTGP